MRIDSSSTSQKEHRGSFSGNFIYKDSFFILIGDHILLFLREGLDKKQIFPIAVSQGWSQELEEGEESPVFLKWEWHPSLQKSLVGWQYLVHKKANDVEKPEEYYY